MFPLKIWVWSKWHRDRNSWRFLKVAVGELPNTQRQCGDKCPAVVRPVAAFQTYFLQCDTVSQAASLVPVHFATTKGRQYSLIVKAIALKSDEHRFEFCLCPLRSMWLSVGKLHILMEHYPLLHEANTIVSISHRLLQGSNKTMWVDFPAQHLEGAQWIEATLVMKEEKLLEEELPKWVAEPRAYAASYKKPA